MRLNIKSINNFSINLKKKNYLIVMYKLVGTTYYPKKNLSGYCGIKSITYVITT